MNTLNQFEHLSIYEKGNAIFSNGELIAFIQIGDFKRCLWKLRGKLYELWYYDIEHLVQNVAPFKKEQSFDDYIEYIDINDLRDVL